MNYYGALFWIVAALGSAAFASYALYRLFRRRELSRIDALPFPAEYETILVSTPHFPKLAEEDRQEMRRRILRFIHTKDFVGIGTRIDDEMRVLIAFYASLLLIRKNAPLPYPHLSTILIYPDSVVIEQNRNDGGVVTSEEVAIDGQSADGTVIITWDAARAEALEMGDYNLILHEFAHEIDFMNGEIDGVPPMAQEHYLAWIDVFDREFETLEALVRDHSQLGKYELFGADAALDEAEFFAVATERFFGAAEDFKEDFGELYERLRTFYGIDAAELFSQSDSAPIR
ncbi:MAG: zinc-dependent peptidase [Campylobacterota bacterium]